MDWVQKSLRMATLLLATTAGCKSTIHKPSKSLPVQTVSTRLENPALCVPPASDGTLEPISTKRTAPTELWDLTLDEVVQIALSNSKILRDLGGQVIRSPESIPSRFEVGITQSDPRFGEQAALSAFDAQLETRLFWQNNDRVFNNVITGLGVNEFQQDLLRSQTALTKRAVTGTQFGIGKETKYDANNSTTNLFPNAWDSNFYLTARHPLLRGGGIEFNRIAGPSAQPGFYFSQGVLLARVNTDISIAEFEAGVIKFLDDVESTYWELYFAYRHLDALGKAKDNSQQVLMDLSEAVSAGTEKGYRQLAAEIQIHALEEQYQSALNGTASGGISTGVYRGERRLRWLMGLPATDGRLIRPSEKPSEAHMAFDWMAISDEALSRRVELRRQGWMVKRKQLELIASKNFTLPQLDIYSTYRVRGFGDDLFGGNSGRFSSAWNDLRSFEHQEWEGGLEFTMPVGMRQGMTAVRNAKLQLTREREILQQQRQRVISELSDAVGEMDRAHESVGGNYRRLMTAISYRSALELAVENEPISSETRVDAINQIADAEIQYHRALVDYMLALKELHRSKGSLLQINGILLEEGAWPKLAYTDARQARDRWVPRHCNDGELTVPVSNGPVMQMIE